MGTGLRDKVLSHEMNLRDMFWRPLPMRLTDLVALFQHKTALAYIAAILVALWAADPHQFRDHFSLGMTALVWLLSGAVLILLKNISFLSVALLSVWRPRTVVYLPILSAYEFFTCILFTNALSIWLSDGEFKTNLIGAYPFYLVTFLTFEMIFVQFILPTLDLGQTDTTETVTGPIPRPQVKDVLTPQPVASATPETVSLANRRLRLDNIQLVTSEEHYLRVVLRGETILHRCKMSDFLDQIQPHHGVQPHRSWWISRHAKPTLAKIGDKPHLTMPGGTPVPIARARLRDVQTWLDLHRDW